MTVAERIAFPLTTDGLRIGLLGGSFNPPHAAHRALSLFALKRLQLDRVWWLVSPGNPLKDTRALPPLGERIAAARAVANHPRIDVTGLEALISTRYTIDTVIALRRKFPTLRFVWLMGADNLAQFHRWRNWQGIAAALPIAVIDRPSDSLRALASPAAQALSKFRHTESRAAQLADFRPPAWVFLRGMKSPLSSTHIRSQIKQSV
ncbi:nicotinic acid mononucleotide adenylyltransferase [Afipia sp. P52-10]|uniref:nicotinate-nucleotide adenylyltransferase n=1 Tax=Afipia sp. P52-10 TaxID=1429916 RepID=UPI0003DEFBDD|nr:nicotinate-nucleotide adenylyltransferase [Afipia sp. P52-10]ETR77600.1 nicotinic acid mononucleotide adenylyltransferase [Afipia sp. P52-10]